MTEAEPDRRVGQGPGAPRSSVKPPRPLPLATKEELAALGVRLREHVRAISRSQELFLDFLEGRATSQQWEEARRVADHARIAYERKCDAILVRTFRI
jgi:hypothetical protein